MTDKHREWPSLKEVDAEPGRSPAAVGGASAGHSDQQAADGHGRVA